MKRLKVLLLTLMLSVSTVAITIPTTVYAAPTEEEEDEETPEANEDQQALLDSINASMDRSASMEDLLSIYAVLKTSDVDDYHSAAILVNGMRESSLVPDAGQSGGGAIGIWQWDGGRRQQLADFSAEQGDQVYNIKGYSIGGVATQVGFMLKELTGGQWISQKPPSSLYTDVNWTEAKEACTDDSIDFGSTMSIEDWQACQDPVALSIYFTACFERCAYGIDIYNEGAAQSPDMYKLLSGAEVEGNTNPDLDKDLAKVMVSSGLWDETQFVKWKVMTNAPIEFADIYNMNADDIYDVENWKNDLEKENSEGILIRGGRFLSMLFGIIFEVWMMLIYLSYWFDRLNNFFDFSVLSILTFGRLRISPDESECTFSMTDLGKGEKRTVNHKKILEVCIIGLAFGALIVSGALFQILQELVNKVLEFLY